MHSWEKEPDPSLAQNPDPHNQTRPYGGLMRSPTEKVFAGICGGLAEQNSSDVFVMRMLMAMVILLSGGALGIIAYAVAAIILPLREGETIFLPRDDRRIYWAALLTLGALLFSVFMFPILATLFSLLFL